MNKLNTNLIRLFGLASVPILCFLAAYSTTFAISASLLLFLSALVYLSLIASNKTLLYILFSILVYITFFHYPFTESRTVYWIQEGLVILFFVVLLLKGATIHINKYIAIVLAMILFVTFPINLYSNSLLIYINGLRRFLLPILLLFTGLQLYYKDIETDILKAMYVSLIIQVPASFIIIMVVSKGFSLSVHPDYYSGTFGGGGNTLLGIYGTLVFITAAWTAKESYISKWLLYATYISFVILVAICDVKIAYILVPFIYLILLLTDKASLARSNILSGKFIVKICLIIILMFGTITVSRYLNVGGMSQLHKFNFFDINSYKKYFSVRSKGVSGYKTLSQDVTILTRYGIFVRVLDAIAKDYKHMLTGYGLGTYYSGELGSSLVKNMLGSVTDNDPGIVILLFEIGYFGTILYLSIILYIAVLAIRGIRRKDQQSDKGDYIISCAMVAYSFCIIVSLFYNFYVLSVPGGGTYWLLAGIFLAGRANQTQPSEVQQPAA